jgi:hypothetical protein
MRKKGVNIFLICTLMVMMGFGVINAEEKSKFSFFIHSGAAFPAFPEGHADFYDSTFNIGAGIGMALSSRLTLQTAASFYCFYPREAYSKYIYFGDIRIELPGKGFYQRDHFFASYNFFVELKYALNSHRFSPYIITGAGTSVRRRVAGGYTGIEGEVLYIGTSVFFIIEGGIGLDYHFDEGTSIFLEVSTNYSFSSVSNKNTGAVPIKLGIIHHL